MTANPLSFSISLCFHTDQEHSTSPPWHLRCIEAIDAYFVHNKEYEAARVVDKNRSIVQLEPHTQTWAAVWMKRVSYLFIITLIIMCLFKLAIRYLLYGTFYIDDKVSEEMQNVEPVPTLSVEIYTPPEVIAILEKQRQGRLQALRETERKINVERNTFKEKMLDKTLYDHTFTEKEIEKRALDHQKKIEDAYSVILQNAALNYPVQKRAYSENRISVLGDSRDYVFTLIDIPGLIFKIGKERGQTLARYKSSKKAAEIVKTHNLDRLIIPTCVLFESWNIPPIIVEEMILAKPGRKEQSDLWQFGSMDNDLRPILQTYIDQLVIFVLNGGSKDVNLNNYLLTDNGTGIACIDNEEVEGLPHPVRSLLRYCLFHEEQFAFAKELYNQLGLSDYEEDLNFAKKKYNYGLDLG